MKSDNAMVGLMVDPSAYQSVAMTEPWKEHCLAAWWGGMMVAEKVAGLVDARVDWWAAVTAGSKVDTSVAHWDKKKDILMVAL